MRDALIAVLLAAVTACSPIIRSTVAGSPTPEQIAELWQEPTDLPSRDLFYGPGGRELAPPSGAVWRYKSADIRGYSPGYDVLDEEGREWDVKLGPEAQSEVVASRILWAMGYHQPPTYFVTSWRMVGVPRRAGARPQPAGRFRPDVPGMDAGGDWSWHRNPFVGTQPYRGLLVLNMILNNWDLKGTNNKVYEATKADDPKGSLHTATALDGPKGSLHRSPQRWFVVRDLGATFGKFRRFPFGTRNRVDDFERQPFIESVAGERVRFAYRGRHHELLEQLTSTDVVWICERLTRLTDRQWEDAFRAADYPAPVKARFIAAIRKKIDEGLALRERAADHRVNNDWSKQRAERERGVVGAGGGAPAQTRE